MEHSVENLIREKVLQADRTPVPWNDERVLAELEYPTRSWHARFAYYAAAALVLSVMIYSMLSVRTHNQQLDDEIALLEEKIARLNDESIAARLPDNCETTPTVLENAEQLLATHGKPAIPKQSRPVGTLSEPIQIANLEVELTSDSLAAVHFVKVDFSEQRPDDIHADIKPIIGVIPQKPIEVVRARKGKLRIFEPSTAANPNQAQTLTARLNHKP